MTIALAVLAAIHALLWIILLGNYRYLRRAPLEAPIRTGPLVSLLIPARNEAVNLRRLLPSLLSQSYEDFEVVLYDDDSTDGTADVLSEYEADLRFHFISGNGPPPGWVGKVNALYQASRVARGEVFIFLDADTEFTGRDSLASAVRALVSRPENAVVTAFPRLAGGGLPLVSLVPHAILTGLPWPLVGRIRSSLLGALNGQFWMIRARDYRRLEPHEHVRDEVLEDVQIGRYMIRSGMTPVMIDMTDSLTVHMYDGFADAWAGFRKNAYLLMGGSPAIFILFCIIFAATHWLCGLVSGYLLLSAVGLKAVSDRIARQPLWVSLLAPMSFVLSSILQLDSARAHWTGRATWKGRKIVS